MSTNAARIARGYDEAVSDGSQSGAAFDAAIGRCLSGARVRRNDWSRPAYIEIQQRDGMDFVAMVMKNGVVGPYSPSHCDMLASDWTEVTEPAATGIVTKGNTVYCADPHHAAVLDIYAFLNTANAPAPAPDVHPAELADLVGKAVYVATPYTKYRHGHDAAAYDAAEVTARLMDLDISALSPIVHSHHVARVGRLDKIDHDFWQRMDAPWVRLAEACVVVKMPGWEDSAGVQHEIAEFRAAGKPVVFMDWEVG